jgi:NhaP-type Na+/H+ or K+/H+ antiporter
MTNNPIRYILGDPDLYLSMPKTFLPVVRVLTALGLLVLIGQFAPQIFSVFEHSAEAELLMIFFSIAMILSLSFAIFYLSHNTPIPNFVIAIFFGMAAHPFLEPVIHNHAVLGSVVGFGATLILFGGGLETPFDNFKKLFKKIMLLSFIGLGITAITFSETLHLLSSWTGFSISFTTAILLGALLASTDPAAIIPILKRLRFKNPEIKDIVISESAVTDVTGTLLTVAFLALVTSGVLKAGILPGYAQIFSVTSGMLLVKQLIFGTAFGVMGYALLHALTKFKDSHDREYEADAAFFLFIPIVIFTLALTFGGSGYLAAFVAGLLFKLSEKLHDTERFFNHTIDGFFKPTIFLMLGALIDVPALISYAPIGISVALIFMFLIRPMAVLISLWPFVLSKSDNLTWRDLMFISFVRETGAIPAVLLVTIASLNLPGIEGLLPIGMWVILATLIIEPPLTPWMAKQLNVAEVIPEPKHAVAANIESAVVLGTRGTSWKNRLPFVVDWTVRHHVKNITLLVCMEYQYTPEAAAEVRKQAETMMQRINIKLAKRGNHERKFEVIVSEGLLQEKINFISQTQNNILAIFVGRKMLDFNLEQIKDLTVPLYFLR